MSSFGTPDLNAKDFVCHRRPTLISFIWSVWLRLPDWLRTKVYGALKRYGKTELSSTRVTRLPFGLYAKHSSELSVTEAFATQFVAAHTSIPVPTILGVLVDEEDKLFILMTRFPGRPITKMPLNASELTDAQRAVFADTVGGWLTQLRQLSPPSAPPAVCGYMGTPFISYRISHTEPLGPYETVDDFHSQYFCSLPSKADARVRALEEDVHKRPYRICFTHGDLSPNNILVDENYVPVALVGWGCAAWLPEYWELTSSLYFRQRYEGWVRIFKTALPDYEDELTVEMELWEYGFPY